jgi:hypothetical protein
MKIAEQIVYDGECVHLRHNNREVKHDLAVVGLNANDGLGRD